MGATDDDLDPALIFPGPVALVAGPGSGKTTRLAGRIKHIVEVIGDDPECITVITFTREAAQHMRERLNTPPKENEPDVTVPPERQPSLIRTMHSLGHLIIAENADRLGIAPDFKVLNDWQLRQVLFEDAARLSGEAFEFGRACNKRKAVTGEPAVDSERRVFETYQRILLACGAIDHDDQIIMACQLLQDHEDLLEHWKRKAKHLLVDEYQDINKPQLRMIQLLSGPDASGLFVVGDDDQSIYSFRGGTPNFIRDFGSDFGAHARVKAIPNCFRCQPHVIKAAHGFIAAFNPDRIPKPEPICRHPEGQLVKVHNAPSDAREAQIMAAIIEDALNGDDDVLVLMPKDGYAEPLKAKLIKRGIAFDAPREKATSAALVFAALRAWLADPDDNLAFRQLIQAVADGDALDIPGPKSRKPEKVAERENALAKISGLWGGVLAGASLTEALREASQSDDMYAKLNTVAQDLSQATGGTPTDLALRTFESLKPWASSKSMLAELAALPSDRFSPGDGDATRLRIMTMRKSKGLEAETVFVMGLEQDAFPKKNLGARELEEAARLFYVSMTRAKKKLYLFHARSRPGAMTFKAQSYRMKGSPFLNGLPKPHYEDQYHKSASKK